MKKIINIDMIDEIYSKKKRLKRIDENS